jgi:hypothetical protein
MIWSEVPRLVYYYIKYVIYIVVMQSIPLFILLIHIMLVYTEHICIS